MSVNEFVNKRYEHGFVTEIESEQFPPGLNEEVIRIISQKKKEPEFLLNWRLSAYRYWLTLKEPQWAHLKISPIDYQAISYYSAPTRKKSLKSLEEVDPKILETYEKLGI